MWNIAGRVALALLPAVVIWYFDRQYRIETMESLRALKQAAEKINKEEK